MPETKLRLSEAMRLGAMLKPQGFEILRDALGRTCALGAAGEAVGHLHLRAIYPILDLPATCPVHGFRGFRLIDAIVSLNDVHCWTRERIADWIEAEFERPEPEKLIEEEPVAVCQKL